MTKYIYLDLEAAIEGLIGRTEDGKYECQSCGKSFPTRWQVQRHAEIHLDCFHTCPICGKVAKTRNALEIHNRTYHGGNKCVQY